MKYSSIGLNKEQVEEIHETLFRKKGVKIKHVGTLSMRKVKSRTFKHNFSGKMMTIPAHSKVHFRPDPKIKRLCTKQK